MDATGYDSFWAATVGTVAAEPPIRRCPTCGGSGEIMTSDKHGYTDYPATCPICDGKGIECRK